MGLVDEQPVTYLTDIHKKVSKRIERLGISVRDEVPFPPYTVDIYLDDLHAAIEVDGPHHSEKKDGERDDYLWSRYHLHVLHIPTGEAKKASHVKKIVMEFIDHYLEYDSSYERRKFAEDNGWQS